MVSVIIPSFNRAATIVDAVNSVLNQTYRDIELIVIDDGSVDNTKEVLSNISDPRFRYVFQTNAGACRARNHGIELAKGEYIAFHDSDDLWHEDKLEKQMKAMLESDADILFCKLNQFNKKQLVQVLPQNISEGFLDPVVTLFGIGTQTLVIKKNVFDTIRFDEELPRFQEFELLLSAVKEGYSLYCLDEGLVDYFIGDDSISVNTEKLYHACRIIVDKHPEIIKNYPVMLRVMGYKLKNEAQKLSYEKNEYYFKYMNLAYKYTRNKKILLYILIRKGKAIFHK